MAQGIERRPSLWTLSGQLTILRIPTGLAHTGLPHTALLQPIQHFLPHLPFTESLCFLPSPAPVSSAKGQGPSSTLPSHGGAHADHL